jgi:hypothetical protein
MSMTPRDAALLEFLAERLTKTLGNHASLEMITKIIRDEAKQLLPEVEDRDIEHFFRERFPQR